MVDCLCDETDIEEGADLIFKYSYEIDIIVFIFSDEKSKTEKISIICKRQKMKRVKQINVNNLSKVSQLFNYSINVSIARTNEFLQQISRNILDLAKAQDKHTFFSFYEVE